MKDRTVTTSIDADECIGCGACVEVCPSETLELVDGTAVVSGDESINCGHCEAVCPSGAVKVAALDPKATRYETFEARREWMPFGEGNLSTLVHLMASRRSCRSYTSEPVSRDALEDLVKIGATAPSGTNSQAWTFTVLPSRDAVLALGNLVARFYRTLNWFAERRPLRVLGRITGRPQLEEYYRDHYEKIKEGLAEFERGERERLFHGATAAILVGSKPDASCPAEDALLATQNILLSAHVMGLGTCLIGFVVEAIRHDFRIPGALGLGKGEKVHSVIALGQPDEAYERVAGRLPIATRVWHG